MGKGRGKGTGRGGFFGDAMEDAVDCAHQMACCACCLVILGPLFVIIGRATQYGTVQYGTVSPYRTLTVLLHIYKKVRLKYGPTI